MSEKTIVDKAGFVVGFGIAAVSNVAAAIKTAFGTAVTAGGEVLTPEPVQETVSEEAVEKVPAKKAAAKSSPANMAAKKAPAKKTAAKKTRLKRPQPRSLHLRKRRSE